MAGCIFGLGVSAEAHTGASFSAGCKVREPKKGMNWCDSSTDGSRETARPNLNDGLAGVFYAQSRWEKIGIPFIYPKITFGLFIFQG